MTQNILEIKTDKGIKVLDATNSGGNGQLFIPRVGEYVFNRKVLEVNYVYDKFFSKAIVIIESK